MSDVLFVPKQQSSKILVPAEGVKADLITKAGVVIYVPLATKSSPGTVQIGDGLDITEEGLLSFDFTNIKTNDIYLNEELQIPDENKNVHLNVDKDTVGLSEVDNTSDIDKPLSTAALEALTFKLDKFQGQGSAGKGLMVGDDGYVTVGNVGGNISIYETDRLISDNAKSLVFSDDMTASADGTVVFIGFDDKWNSVFKNVSYNPTNGILTFTKMNNSTIDVDLPLELIIKSGYYDVDSKELVLVLANDTKITIPVGDLVNEYYADNTTLELYDDNGKATFRVKQIDTSNIKDGAVTNDKIQSVDFIKLTNYENAPFMLKSEADSKYVPLNSSNETVRVENTDGGITLSTSTSGRHESGNIGIDSEGFTINNTSITTEGLTATNIFSNVDDGTVALNSVQSDADGYRQSAVIARPNEVVLGASNDSKSSEITIEPERTVVKSENVAIMDAEEKSTILLSGQGTSVVSDNVIVASSNVENGFVIRNEQMDLFGNVKLNDQEIATKDDIVQSDWNETDTTSKAYILNKPTIPEGVPIYQEKGQNTDGAMSQKATTDELNKLDEKVKDLELFKFPNATIVGEPTISNGQVSDFTNQDYLQFPFIVDLKNKPFEIDFAYTTDDNVTSQQNILDSYFGLALAIINGNGTLALSSNGSSWDIGVFTGNYTVLPNTTYYVKLIWDGNVYKTYIGTDENNLVEDIVVNSSLAPHPRTVFIGGSYGLFGAGTDHRFYGTINMNKALLKVQDIVVWTGMDDVGISSRADVSLSNIDEAGKQVIKNQTQPQIDVLNQVIGDIDEEIVNLNSAVANKQGKLTQPQLDATNSGITQTKVAEYDTVKQQYLKNATIDNENHLTITKQDDTTVVYSGGTTVTVDGVAQTTWDADTKADKTTVQNQGTIINLHTTSISALQTNKADKSEIPDVSGFVKENLDQATDIEYVTDTRRTSLSINNGFASLQVNNGSNKTLSSFEVNDASINNLAQTSVNTWVGSGDYAVHRVTADGVEVRGTLKVNGKETALHEEIPTDYAKFEEHTDLPDLIPYNYYSKDEINTMINDLKSLMHPIGFAFISYNDIDYTNYLGFTWQKEEAGRTLWSTDSGAGTKIEAGLPNIEGVFRAYAWSTSTVEGSFSTEIASANAIASGSSTNYNYDKFIFDASKSNSIYGASDTVQPPAVKVCIWRRIA